MKISGKRLLQIDRLFRAPYRVYEFLLNGVRTIHPRPSDKHIVIKFMGLGSLLQMAALFHKSEVDRSRIVLITLSPNRELCQLLEFEHVLYIRTNNIFVFAKDCIAVLFKVRSVRPLKIIDYERCSNAVGLYRTLMANGAECQSISFEKRDPVNSHLQIVYPIDHYTQEELFRKGIEFLPKAKHEHPQQKVVVQPRKVIININSSNYLLARRYSIDSFAATIQSLYQWNSELEFYFTGSSEESTYVAQLEEKISGLNVHNVSGKWNLEKLSQELSTSALFITGDSGPLHLATYLSIPTLAIWGPTQPGHFGYNEKKNVYNISLGLTCSPCFKHPASQPAVACKGKIDCMRNLDSSIIVKKAIEILSSADETRSINMLTNSIIKNIPSQSVIST